MAIESFRFWCQKVLPLVYDDSLSYYELLCKVVVKLNEVISTANKAGDDVAQLTDLYNKLLAYVNNYFSDLNIQNEINNKLDAMAESGELGAILIEALNLRISPDRKEKYQEAIRKNVVSYLAINAGGTFFKTGEAVEYNGKKIIVKYSNDKTWQSYRWGSTPVYTDEVSINGESYRVLYCDCSSFSCLVFMGIPFGSSPYAYGFDGGVVNSEEMLVKGFPNNNYKTDWATDFNSLQNTKQMSYILTESGFNSLMLSEHTAGQEIVYHQNNINVLETGDIIFSGSGVVNGNIYERTGHCAVYIKTLEELKQYADAYGFELQPTDDDDPAWGFIAEVAYSTNTENDYTNCLNFGTLKHHMDRTVRSAQNITYAYKMVGRTTSSNAASHKYTGIWRDYNKLYFVPIHKTNPFDAGIMFHLSRGAIDVNNAIIRGELITTANADADTIGPGVWRCTSGPVLSAMQNVPLNSNYFILECEGTNINGKFYGFQRFNILSSVYPRVYTRSCTAGVWSGWSSIPRTDDGAVVFETVEANSSKRISVTFDTPFDAVPVVVATLRSAGDSYKIGLCSLSVSNITETGFDITAYNASDVNIGLNANWVAVTRQRNE